MYIPPTQNPGSCEKQKLIIVKNLLLYRYNYVQVHLHHKHFTGIKCCCLVKNELVQLI